MAATTPPTDAPHGARPHSSRSGAGVARTTARFAWHVVLLACWALVIVMGLLVWAPHVTRYKTDVIVGQSMEPAIPLWSVIVDEPVRPAEVRVGDVITFEQADVPGRKVTHRVVRIERTRSGEPSFVTKGDNNEVRDPWRVTYEGTAWRVVHHVPRIGRVIAWTQTRWARVALVAAPILLLLAQALRWIWREDEPGSDEWAPDAWQDDDEWIAA